MRWARLVSDHQLASYFVLAFAISWALMLLVPGYASVIAAFGPALAAMAVMSTVHRGSTGIPRGRRWGLFAVLCIVVFPLGYFTNLNGVVVIDSPLLRVAYFAVFTALAAFVVSGVLARNRGVFCLLRPLMMWKAGIWWYVAAVALPPLIFLLSDFLTGMLGQGPVRLNLGEAGRASVGGLVVAYLVTLVFSGPLGEEVGWRGLATPLVQRRYTPLVASLVLGVIWVLWHAPWHFNGFYATYPDGITILLLRFISMIPMTLVYTALYNGTRGSLLFVLLFHTSEDASFYAIGLGGGFGITFSFYVFSAVWVVVGLLTILVFRMWQPLPPSRREALTDVEARAAAA